MVTELIAHHSALRAHLAGWDALAVACSRPFCSPGWLLAWWQHSRPRDAELQVVVVRDGDRVVGVAPWFGRRGRLGARLLRPLGAGTCQRVEPLALPGREREVAASIAETLAGGAAPDVVHFEGVDAASPWPGLLASTWPGGPARTVHRGRDLAPTLDLRGGDFDAWMAGKSRNFRHGLRKGRRAFERSGGRLRMATSATIERDLAAFVALHHARWEPRGGSGALDARSEAMLLEAARELLPEGRLRLLSLDLGGEVISSHLALTAGGEYAYWLAGFDDRHAKLSPSLLGALALIEDAFAAGASRFDFGAGPFAYKLRFADGTDVQEHLRLVPRGRRAPLALAEQAPGQVRRLARTVRMRAVGHAA